jgi:phospholipase C
MADVNRRDPMSAAFDRRRFLEAALIAGAGALAVGAGGIGSGASASTVRRAAGVLPAGSDLGAIEHVIFLMQENRSFDHYYGTYHGVRGFDDHPKRSLGAFSQPYPANATRPPVGRLLPYHLDTATGLAECIHDLTHNWVPQHQSRNGGAMDDFVKVHTESANDGPEYGVLTMGYYTRSDLPYYHALADAFTICDGYHCSVLGPTHPNRLMALSGTIDPGGTHGGPVLITNPLPEARFSVSWPTMPEVLEDAGVSWKVYSPPGQFYRADFDEVLAISDAILPYFSQYSNPSSALYKKAFTPIYPTDFKRDVARGTLPAVSWIIPPLGYDEHPPAPPALGEWFTDQLLQTLVASPDLWSKTVLFHMYDENDGLFDHVPPPVAPPRTPGEYVTVDPLPATAGGVAGPVGLGYRVPMLVISPFSRGGHVSSETFDHTSQLRFLEERFGVRAPNISRWRRRTVGDLTGALHMGRADRSKPKLPSTARDTVATVMTMGCQEDDLIEIRDNQPPYPLPAVQSMPVQESSRS